MIIQPKINRRAIKRLLDFSTAIINYSLFNGNDKIRLWILGNLNKSYLIAANAGSCFVLPHPSPLNIKWFKNNPQFEREKLTQIRAAIKKIVL